MRRFIPWLTAILLGGSLLGSGGCSQGDPAGAVAPAPAATLAALASGSLVRADGSTVDAATLQGKTILVYFSAHWCPPCRAFTPRLVAAYDTWKAQNKPVELVFVSFDHDAAAMGAYLREARMNWLAVPFAEEARRNALAALWNVEGIPSLIVVSPRGDTLTTEGTAAIQRQNADALAAWLGP